jgi:hypothetical protein
METNEINEGNKLIAQFMGWTNEGDENYWRTPNDNYEMPNKFHSSWDWLMPVVEKIGKEYRVKITWMPDAIDVTYIERTDVFDDEITSFGGGTVIENTFKAVVQFIKWHNTNEPA